MADRDDVCILLPTFNEAETIESVVSGFREQGFDDVLVIDGGSTDGTQDIAESAGARVVEQSGSGKGQAVREAVTRHIEQPYVLMADGDATYRPDEADRLLKPLLSGQAAHVIGNRFADMQPGAMTKLNQIGNRIINRAFETIHGRDLTDILSGYRAFTRQSFQRSSLTASGFGIETEMAVECVKHNVSTAVVPITYQPRPDESDTNLRPFRDGATIILTLYQMAKTNNPLFYFGSVGLGSTVVGFLLGAYVAYDWVVNSISHEVIAVVGSFAILLGIQLLMFGVLSDMLVAVNREQTRRLEDIAVQLTHESRSRPVDVFDDQRVGDAEHGKKGDAEDTGDSDIETEPAVSSHSSDE
ncbi:glycosyl transferase [Haloarcula hispanica N601]|uniref:Glycosyl transferase n=3 Tax=Haloarcula hispanica TaxID=51589 RepID=V5TKM1_HALHI|nr:MULTISPECIES: S-layer glycoprotein N-glycosyltransferase AglJ [Haloarcula]AEM56829.1 glycosyltransferase-like protein [Haloarcula hispanica ATCC 33960]AHB65623.1 glycosyl transferase [Haloarcula hispanica N601]AJF26742.1 glycosyl transferase [Haloarcula sp. CBA1115]KAA9407428.1 S-layer glycoprotein N-glycosyltransferase AglJ [Haloarcula sp. CBA1131]MCJ0618506.1 S-layer glycoprotein N-glycosyltransferase AglJ [Haloarcula hispanica]